VGRDPSFPTPAFADDRLNRFSAIWRGELEQKSKEKTLKFREVFAAGRG
jgi:hypothetical protein